ncbi:MAG TPA: hypothetical protein PKM48_03880 [Parvularculaceae bacterium]|nr:hypothetical protein [Parvularculaceae bacterium]HNS86309.1 hypothetical protein [Parvularculaceae bacterium]
MRLAAVLIFAALLAACDDPPVFSGRNIYGPYYLVPEGVAGGEKVCLRNSAGRCDLRAPAPVDALGADGEYISVRTAGGVAAPDDYYIIVQLFDSTRADGERCLAHEADRLREHRKKSKRLTCDKVFDKSAIERRESNCAVRGPFSKDEFEVLRLCSCVPEGPGADALKCIPDVVALSD